MFLKCFEIFQYFTNFRMYFCILVYCVQLIVILYIGFGFCVFNCLWEHRLNEFSKQKKSNIFHQCHRSENNFRTDRFVRDVFGFWVLNGPH